MLIDLFVSRRCRESETHIHLGFGFSFGSALGFVVVPLAFVDDADGLLVEAVPFDLRGAAATGIEVLTFFFVGFSSSEVARASTSSSSSSSSRWRLVVFGPEGVGFFVGDALVAFALDFDLTAGAS